MPDTIERAVCPECGKTVYDDGEIDGASCPTTFCRGTLEAKTFVSEAALRELQAELQEQGLYISSGGILDGGDE